MSQLICPYVRCKKLCKSFEKKIDLGAFDRFKAIFKCFSNDSKRP